MAEKPISKNAVRIVLAGKREDGSTFERIVGDVPGGMKYSIVVEDGYIDVKEKRASLRLDPSPEGYWINVDTGLSPKHGAYVKISATAAKKKESA